MALFERIRHELTRRRGRRRRGEGGARSSRSGIALLLTVTIVALMTVLVTEIMHSASVRLQLAANQRDEAKAEALAQGGVQFYRLLLVASKQLEGSPIIQMASQFLPFSLNADSLWQLLPSINSGFMRLILLSDGDEDEARQIMNRGMTDAEREESRELAQTSLRKQFLDFDGDFTASVVDEDSRIFVGRIQAQSMEQLFQNPHAQLLAGLMSGERQDEFLRNLDIDKWDLISNLVDWTDADDLQLYRGGREDQLYDNLANPYRAKNSAFDTLQELRLVDGWQADSVWHRYGQNLTIYGAGRININTAPRRVMEALLLRYVQPEMTEDSLKFVIDEINRFRNTPPELGGGIFQNPQSFVGLLRQFAPGTVDDGLANAITTKSSVFRVTSEGDVGKSKVRIDAVMDFSSSAVGKIVYWHIQ
jgi:general secretion pathway protein K